MALPAVWLRREILWVATVRPDGRPHLVPVSFDWVDGRVFLCTSAASVKARNKDRNPRVVVALQGSTRPLICEGTRALLRTPWRDGVVAAFERKYEWKSSNEVEYTQRFRIFPEKWLTW